MSADQREGEQPEEKTVEDAFELRAAPGHLVRRLQQAHREIWSTEVPGGITSAQFAVLSVLEQKPCIDQRRLGELVGTDRSTTADMVRRLTARRLITRLRDVADQRRNLLRLTPDGLETLHAAIPAANRVSRKMVYALEERDRAEFLRLLILTVDSHLPPLD